MSPARTYLRLGSLVDWAGAIYSGLIAGSIFFFLQIFLLWATGLNIPWEFPQKIAAIVLGPDVFLRPAAPRLPMMLVALVVHLGLSILYTAILAVFIQAWNTGTAILLGIAFGLVIYLFNYYLLTALFPWFAEARHWVTVLGHAVFGATAAWAYRGFHASSKVIAPPA